MNMPSHRLLSEKPPICDASFPMSAAHPEQPPVAITSGGSQPGLLSQARGVVLTEPGVVGTLVGVLAPLSAQGATLAAVDSQTREPELDTMLARLRDGWGRVDFLIHCATPTDTGQRVHPYIDADAAAFQAAMTCGVHRFAAIARRARNVMVPGGRVLSVSWPWASPTGQGHALSEVVRAAQTASVRCLAEDLGPMGIRVNAIAAGPIRPWAYEPRGSRQTLPLSGRHRAPLRRDVTPEEIGKAAVYLLSSLSSGTTGITLQVDAGHHVIGLRGTEPHEFRT